jgi:tryptophanyl-tRNA synthetase
LILPFGREEALSRQKRARIQRRSAPSCTREVVRICPDHLGFLKYSFLGSVSTAKSASMQPYRSPCGPLTFPAMSTPARRLLSGITPTGELHIGNYFGAMRQWLDLQRSGLETFVFVADLHALNQIHDPARLSEAIRGQVMAYLAIGLDPQKVTIFRQSDVPAHAELCWIFNSITSMGLMERAHAYKDALANGKLSSVGLFDYPILMAADILLYKPDLVPVGKDQQQHVEIAADIAGRFNHLFGQTLKIPEVMVLPEVAVVPGLDGRKMSKSYGNVISLFDAPEIVRKKAMSILTDSKTPGELKSLDGVLYQLHSLVLDETGRADLIKRYQEGISYKDAKESFAADLNVMLDPIRARKLELDADPGYLARVLEEGRVKASAVANATLAEVKQNVGLNAFTGQL